MRRHPKVRSGLVGLVGYLLSPLSWWNDLFVNVPLALAFAWIISLFYPPGFAASFVAGYWLTNLLGFLLLHKGARELLAPQQRRPYSRKDLARDVLVSLAYTLLILALVRFELVEPLPSYLPKK